MKTIIKMSAAFLFVAFIFAGCGGQKSEKEQDAQKLAEIACEMRIMGMELNEGDFEGLTKFTEKMAEFSELAQSIEAKYGIPEDDPEFEALIREALKETPCGDVELDDLFDFFE
jgi:hypothetical protein